MDTGYTDEAGLRELVQNSQNILSGLQLAREKVYMQRLFTEIRKADGGLSAYGEDEVRSYLINGAVDIVLLSEAIKKRRITVQCQQGHVHELTVADSDANFPCPECGAKTQITSDEDFIDDFFNKAEMFSTRVQLISPDSEEGDMLLKAFGGVAALLRYRM